MFNVLCIRTSHHRLNDCFPVATNPQVLYSLHTSTILYVLVYRLNTKLTSEYRWKGRSFCIECSEKEWRKDGAVSQNFTQSRHHQVLRYCQTRLFHTLEKTWQHVTRCHWSLLFHVDPIPCGFLREGQEIWSEHLFRLGWDAMRDLSFSQFCCVEASC